MLGTLVEVRLPDAAYASGAFERAFAAVERVHRLMSRQHPGSDVSRINRATAGERIAVDPWTWNVLRRAKDVHRATAGLFDCTLTASFDNVQLADECGVVLRRPVTISLDGIAKGYAVDRAVDALREAGATRGAVDAGGDLRIFGDKWQPIYVRHPGDPRRLVAVGTARDAAVASSARYFGNSTLIDPRTRRARSTGWSATVIAADCATADALTKPCLLERRRAQSLAAKFGGRVVLLSPRHLQH